MSRKNLFGILAVLVMMSMAIASCAPAAPAAPAEEEAAPKGNAPTEVKIAVLTADAIDEPYVKSLLQAFDRFNKDNDLGIRIVYDYTERTFGDDAERAMRAYSETGEYDIIWSSMACSDQIKNVMDEYPEIMFVQAGSGNVGLGKNVYWIFGHVHEGAYLLGIAAGMMSQTKTVGVVAGYPYEDVNDVLNGFKDGVKSVSADNKVKISFIESWYDPPKAKETTYGLISAGADMVYAERFGPFDALAEKGLYGFGNYEDQYYMAPEVVVSSAILLWDPHVNYIVKEWLGHKVDGKAWNGTIDPVWFGLKDGGTDIAPFYDKKAPQEVKDAVLVAQKAIIDGSLKVDLKIEEPVSD